MMLQSSGIIPFMAMNRERRRRLVRAFVTAGATWAAASAGFAETPSRFQLVMSGVAAVLTGGMVAFGPQAPVASSDLKNFDTARVSLGCAQLIRRRGMRLLKKTPTM
jgi:hypothetical protein